MCGYGKGGGLIAAYFNNILLLQVKLNGYTFMRCTKALFFTSDMKWKALNIVLQSYIKELSYIIIYGKDGKYLQPNFNNIITVNGISNKIKFICISEVC